MRRLSVINTDECVCKTKSRSERDFFDNRGRLVIVAVTNPSGPYHKVGDVRPIQMRLPLWPDCEVDLLIAHQVWPVRLTCNPFKLHRLLSCPPDDKRAIGPCDEIGVFPGRLHSVEDNLQFWTDCDAYQCGLRGVISRNARYYPVPMSRHEGMQSNSIHRQAPESPPSL